MQFHSIFPYIRDAAQAGSPATPANSCATAPGGGLGRFLCDPGGTFNAFMAWISFTLSRLISAAGPWFPIGVAAVLAAGAVLTVALLRSRRTVLQGGRWLEIIPPAQAPGDGAAFWRTVVGIANQHRRGLLRPGRLAVEVWAVDGAMRAGIWVPGRMPAASVADAVRHSLPGCRVLAEAAPPPPIRGRAKARELHPIDGPWTPLVDPAPRLVRGAVTNTDDPLRSVYGALSGAPGRACLQLVISSHRRRGRGSGLQPVVAALLTIPVWVLRGVLNIAQDLMTTRSASAPTVSRAGAAPVDPVTAARQRDEVTKRALSPHAHVTVRVIVTGADRAEVVDGVEAGYPLSVTAAELASARARRWRSRLVHRAPGRGFYVTVAELVALWHLPPEPSAYGLPDSRSRTRRAPRDLPRQNPRSGWSDTGWPNPTGNDPGEDVEDWDDTEEGFDDDQAA